MNALNRKLEKEYYAKQMNGNLGNMKRTSKIINEIVNKTSKTKTKTTKTESIKIKNKTISDSSKIPNLMNSYFCSIGETLKAIVAHQLNSLLAGKYIVNPNSSSQRVQPYENFIWLWFRQYFKFLH